MRAIAFILAGVIMSSVASAQDRTTVVLGTATPGGGFPVYGAAFSEALNAADPTLLIQPKNTKGSTENIPMLEAGQLDIGQATGEVIYEAITGIGRAPADLRIVSAMYSNFGMFIVRADSPVRTIEDLKGKAIAWGAKGSGFVVLARYVVEAMGLNMDRDFQSTYLERAGDGPAMVLDGRATALWGGSTGWPAFVAVANGPLGARFIPPSADDVRRITAKHSFIKPLTLPAGSFPGQSAPIPTVGSWSFVLARPSLSEDTAYRMARALHKSQPALGAKLAQAAESTLANTLAAAPRQDLIHPGVLRYMREIGLVK
jgi:uncharacterized protein